MFGEVGLLGLGTEHVRTVNSANESSVDIAMDTCCAFSADTYSALGQSSCLTTTRIELKDMLMLSWATEATF